MAGPDRKHPDNLVDVVKNVFDTAPEGEAGVGPTLGQNLDTEAPKPAKRPQAATPSQGSDSASRRGR